jgi:hypothetical protein
MEVLGKYRLQDMCTHKDSGFVSTCHPCRASMAKLKPYRPRNPSLPSHFGFESVSQLNQYALFSLSCCAHQYRHITILISSQSVGESKHDIAKVGIACAHALIKICFLDFDSILSFHTLYFKYSKVFALDLPTHTGKPRYFFVLASVLIFNSIRTWFHIISFVFALNITNDLSSFHSWWFAMNTPHKVVVLFAGTCHPHVYI